MFDSLTGCDTVSSFAGRRKNFLGESGISSDALPSMTCAVYQGEYVWGQALMLPSDLPNPVE